MKTRLFAALSLAFCLGTSGQAKADTSASALAPSLASLPDGGARFLQLSGAGSTEGHRGEVLVQVQNEAAARLLGMIPLSEHWALAVSSPSTWGQLAAHASVQGLRFAPARSLQLDLASKTISTAQAHEETGLDGQGTIIGVVDTGADASHPALRHDDGTTRIAWMLAFGQSPLGVHEELESEYGCDTEDELLRCAIYSAEDINQILESNLLARLPKDRNGHGTHITSIAAGRDDDYPGVASQADLIVVAAASASGGVSDGKILLGTRFVFDRAQESAKPAVVNISLGSSFGAHDGSSAVERGLAELASEKGRAIVVASGNSGSVHADLSPDYPSPFGIHAEVVVPKNSQVLVPVLTSPGSSETTRGTVFIWISTGKGQSIEVAFDSGSGKESAWLPPGQSGALNSSVWKDEDEYDVIMLNGVDEGVDPDIAEDSIVVAITGSWKAGRTFGLKLRGQGTARMWVSGTEGAAASATSRGPLLPRARAAGTVTVPGSQADLITVGSTFNRSSWFDYTDTEVGYPGGQPGHSDFSSSGPTQLGDLKPELSAPGSSVIAAMAREADPRTSLSSQSLFASRGACPDEVECFVVDDEHGVASGTSMAAPLVTGTIALLMQREPELSMLEAKNYLMAGGRPLERSGLASPGGSGELNVLRTLLAQESHISETSGTASVKYSRLIWAEQFAHPAPAPPLNGAIILRDKDDESVALMDEQIEILITGPASVNRKEDSTGLSLFAVQAHEGSEGQTLKLKVLLDGELLSEESIEIARDPQVASLGAELTGASCQAAPSRQESNRTLGGLLFALLIVSLRRRRLAH